MDINGVDIYEGDIVKDIEDNEGVIKYSNKFCRLNIVFNKGRDDLTYKKFGFHAFNWTSPEMLLEVIGNIYDTPELPEG